MEIEFDLPRFTDNGVKQRFRIRSRNYEWRGEAETRGIVNVPLTSLRRVIEESIRDASRGYEYSHVGRLGEEYRYRVRLFKEDGWRYVDVSSIEIKVYTCTSDEKAFIRITPSWLPL